MLPDLTHAIVKITSSAAGNANFGTGFVICRAADGDYVLTCKHVVNAVGKANMLTDGQPAAEVVSGDEKGLDLAVLIVKSGLTRTPLTLNAATTPGGEFVTRGYYTLSAQTYAEDGFNANARISLSETLTGSIDAHHQTTLDYAGHCVPAWRLTLPDTESVLQPGYSGAPVLDKASGGVIGVISIRTDAGQQGLAISVQALNILWPDHPANLFSEPTHREPHPLVIDFKNECEAFTQIVTGADQQTRLILVHGASGMGKSYLVKEMYRHIAAAHRCKTVLIDLQEQCSVEECLYQIICELGDADFSDYHAAALEALKSPHAKDEEKWQILTRPFFSGLRRYRNAPKVILLFDAYDRARPEESFKNWLTRIVLPQLAAQTNIVLVISGQQEVTPPSMLKPCYHKFPLIGVSVKHFQEYAEAHRIFLTADKLELAHTVAQGKPSLLAYYIQSEYNRLQRQEG